MVIDCRALTLDITLCCTLRVCSCRFCLSVCLSALFIATPTDRCAFYPAAGVLCGVPFDSFFFFGRSPALALINTAVILSLIHISEPTRPY